MIETIFDGNADPHDDEAIARLEAALAQLGRDVMPPLGWEARVLAAIACDELDDRAGPRALRDPIVNRLSRLPARAWPSGS